MLQVTNNALLFEHVLLHGRDLRVLVLKLFVAQINDFGEFLDYIILGGFVSLFEF